MNGRRHTSCDIHGPYRGARYRPPPASARERLPEVLWPRSCLANIPPKTNESRAPWADLWRAFDGRSGLYQNEVPLPARRPTKPQGTRGPAAVAHRGADNAGQPASAGGGTHATGSCPAPRTRTSPGGTVRECRAGTPTLQLRPRRVIATQAPPPGCPLLHEASPPTPDGLRELLPDGLQNSPAADNMVTPHRPSTREGF